MGLVRIGWAEQAGAGVARSVRYGLARYGRSGGVRRGPDGTGPVRQNS